MKLIGLRKLITLLIAAMPIIAFVACNNAKPTNDNSNISTKTITDRTGKTITLPDKVDKIISMAPSVTETLVHLGLADKLVAIDKYSSMIEGLPPNLPTYDIMTPDTESLAALKPDIIFATGMSNNENDDPFKPITDLGVLMTYIPSSTSIEGIKEDIRFIGQITNTSDKAENIIKEIDDVINVVTTKIGNEKCNKTVYFEIEDEPKMISFGKGVFLNEIVELLGAKNIFSDLENWVSLSEETIIEKNPDVIFTNVDYTDHSVANVLNRNGWSAVNAVKNNQVFQINRNASSRPNEYVTVAIQEMARALYPHLFT